MPRTSLALVLLLFVVVTAGRAQTSADAADPALGTRDYLEIEQLVYEHGWALDSGENDGFAYADLYTADGTFTDTSQGPNGRTYQGRENLAALARGAPRGPFNVSHLVTNLIVTPTADGAIGRAYVGIFDPGGPDQPPGAGHGGFYDDVYLKTPQGWRFQKRTYYEGKWGEPDVPLPPPVAGVRALRAAEAEPVPDDGTRLSDRDYIEIQQLVARLPYGLDMNADDGASYASGFTADGTFTCVLADTAGAPSRLPAACTPHSDTTTAQVEPRARGREALARMATEETHGPNYVRHFVFNHVIEPSENGATGKAYVALIDIVPGQQGSGHSIFVMGRYDDEYLKTSDGWRIQDRVFTVVARPPPDESS